MTDHAALANPMTLLLDKSPADFTRADMLRVVAAAGHRAVHLPLHRPRRQAPELKLPFTDYDQAERILAAGERVDGSSLFKGLVDASASDLYVVPSYAHGLPEPLRPQQPRLRLPLPRPRRRARPVHPGQHPRHRPRAILRAHRPRAARPRRARVLPDPRGRPRVLQRPAPDRATTPRRRSSRAATSSTRWCATSPRSPARSSTPTPRSATSTRSAPTCRCCPAAAPSSTRSSCSTRPIEEMGDFVALARWIIRNVAYRHGMLATFAPKIEEGVAGNGFHFHLELIRDGRNVMTDSRRRAVRGGAPS